MINTSVMLMNVTGFISAVFGSLIVLQGDFAAWKDTGISGLVILGLFAVIGYTLKPIVSVVIENIKTQQESQKQLIDAINLLTQNLIQHKAENNAKMDAISNDLAEIKNKLNNK